MNGRSVLKSLPLCRLSVLQPIVAGLQERGIDPAPVLESTGLTEDAVWADETSVHIMVVHQFLENAAAATGDPTFAASLGLRADTRGWPVLKSAFDSGQSLGDLLSIYVSLANELASSVQTYLEVRDQFSIFGEKRLFKPTIRPAQNDGYMVALAYSMLKQALGKNLDPAQLTLIVCEPKALPASLKNGRCLAGDDMGFRIQFPARWLTLRVDEPAAKQNDPVAVSLESRGFLDGFRGVLKNAVGSGRISASDAAGLVHMTRSQLARRLSKYDTDITTEINAALTRFAKEQLSQSRRQIGDIADALGFSDAANFARAFRKQTGLSPSEFRRKSKSSAEPPQ